MQEKACVLSFSANILHSDKGYKGYKDGLQPETLADGNCW